MKQVRERLALLLAPWLVKPSPTPQPSAAIVFAHAHGTACVPVHGRTGTGWMPPTTHVTRNN